MKEKAYILNKFHKFGVKCLQHPGSQTLKKINASVLALPLLLIIIMLAACVIKCVGYCQSGKSFLL